MLAVAPLAAIACARAPRVEVAAVPLSRAGEDHALVVDASGWADTRVDAALLTRGDFTVALRFAWQHPRAAFGWLLAESRWGTFLIGKADGAGRIHVNLGGQVIEGATEIPRGRLAHVAVCVRGGTASLYLDGRLEQQAKLDARRPFAGGPLEIGRRGDRFAVERIVATVDDLWMVEEALDAAAIATLATGGAPPARARVLAAFTFEPGAPLPRLQGDARLVALGPAGPLATWPDHATPLGLPFDGAWQVVQGFEGDVSHQAYAAFALDFVPFDEDLGPGLDHRGPGKALDDWLCWDRPVLAPAAGVVVAVEQGRPDLPPGEREPVSNRVVIQHGPREFSEIVHLEQGSVPLAVGQRVTAGEVVGRCGNSGNAGSPHIHYALLSSLDPVMTRPLRFVRFERRDRHGRFAPAGGTPSEGEVVRPAP